MKELSIEEKAKAYDEALKQIKDCTPDENGFITIYPQEIFPELKESDDEKIRKRIIALVNAHGQGMYKDEMLAWLEKQGRQKPAWSEEDDSHTRNIINWLDVCKAYNQDAESIKLISQHIAWLKSLRPQSQWKPSEEQMLAINTAINVLGKGTINGKYLIELQEQLKKLMEE